MPDPNLPLLEDAVRKLAPFLDEIVFVGGVTLGLLITDKAAAPIRGTNDVDVIAEIVTYADYIAFSERLRRAHFTEDAGENPLTCRWHNGSLTLDVLALSEEVLGFTNIWYKLALKHAFTVTLPGGQSIRVITAPFFLGTKMEAFRGRGRWTFRPATILKTLLLSLKDGRRCYRRSPRLRNRFGSILRMPRRCCLPNPDFLTSFLDLSWTTSESHSSKNALHPLQPIFPEIAEV
jgi:hypothetical protein